MACHGTLTTRDVFTHAELLDDLGVSDDVRLRAQRDVARANWYFGGLRVIQQEIRAALGDRAASCTSVLDVGAGSGDALEWIRRWGARRGDTLQLLGVDVCPILLRAARGSGTHSVCGNGFSLPFRSRSVDVVFCSQLLHHFVDGDAVRLLGELDRVARYRVFVCDLRRSRIAAGAFWLASHPLRFHPVTRHDGVASVRRGFTPAELTRLVQAATGRRQPTRRSLGFRLAVSWTPTGTRQP